MSSPKNPLQTDGDLSKEDIEILTKNGEYTRKLTSTSPPFLTFTFTKDKKSKNDNPYIIIKFTRTIPSTSGDYETDPNYTSFTIKWVDDTGKHYHRDNDLPATVTYNKDGIITNKRWLQNNCISRENGNGPSECYFYVTKNEIYSSYKINNELHRDNDLPAEIEYDVDNYGNRSEYYSKRGRYHRRNGPAIVDYKDGKVISYDFYYEGKKYKSVVEWLEVAKDNLTLKEAYEIMLRY